MGQTCIWHRLAPYLSVISTLSQMGICWKICSTKTWFGWFSQTGVTVPLILVDFHASCWGRLAWVSHCLWWPAQSWLVVFIVGTELILFAFRGGTPGLVTWMCGPTLHCHGERVYRENNLPSCVSYHDLQHAGSRGAVQLVFSRERVRIVPRTGWFHQPQHAQRSSHPLPSQILCSYFGRHPTMLPLCCPGGKPLDFPWLIPVLPFLTYVFPLRSLPSDPCTFPCLSILLWTP